MFRASSEEKNYLRKVIKLIDKFLDETKAKIDQFGLSILSDKRSLWENIYELDPVEIMQAQEQIEGQVMTGDMYVKDHAKYQRMRKSPYFARIDFIDDEDKTVTNVYIGLGALLEKGSLDFYVYDWRAPISSMFYEYELGKAKYEAPSCDITGEIILKRHYKIEDDKIIYYADSGSNISDDILMECLAQTSDQKMHNIVSTIQKEQNSVIRNVTSNVLVIQGAAGSGKTSIALHRAAFLLYKYKGKLTSKEILVISPNKIFSEYISGVLPELDEENILQCEANQIAEDLLPDNYHFETAWEQAEKIIDGNDPKYVARAKYKSSMEFFTDLKHFVDNSIDSCFNPIPFKVGNYEVTKDYLYEKFLKYSKYTPTERANIIFEDIVSLGADEGLVLKKRELRQRINQMFNFKNALTTYEEFFSWAGKEQYFVHGKNRFEYADLFPMAYIEARFNGKKPIVPIKHLIIDEMQDYSPVCFGLINLVYDCNKTILGDIAQSISGIRTSIGDVISCFDGASVIELNKSYRSTYEIIEFSKKIKPELANIESVVRHGEEVTIAKAEDVSSYIRQAIKEADKKYRNIKQANELYKELKENKVNVCMIDEKKNAKAKITTVQLSKGLEFDYVIVVGAEVDNYRSESDRDLLYVACTRAMHKLDVIYSKELTKIISE